MSVLSSADLNHLDAQRALADPSRLLVACLCAEWCDTCREFRSSFDELAARHPEASFVWLDIEDDSELIEDLDFEVENFPTAVIERGAHTIFAGTILPQAAILERLIETLSADGAPSRLRRALLAEKVES